MESQPNDPIQRLLQQNRHEGCINRLQADVRFTLKSDHDIRNFSFPGLKELAGALSLAFLHAGGPTS